MLRWLPLLLLLAQPTAAAVVDGWVVTRSEVDEFQARDRALGAPSRGTSAQTALEELIERALIRNEAEQLDIEVTEQELEAAVRDIR